MEKKKQEIIDLLDQADNNGLDWILYLLKLHIEREGKGKHLVDSNAKKVWDKASIIIRKELTQLSYNTWVRDVIPIEIENNLIRLGVENEFTRGILKNRYLDLFKKALLLTTNEQFEIEFLI